MLTEIKIKVKKLENLTKMKMKNMILIKKFNLFYIILILIKKL